jgi:hypothetical protein
MAVIPMIIKTCLFLIAIASAGPVPQPYVVPPHHGDHGPPVHRPFTHHHNDPTYHLRTQLLEPTNNSNFEGLYLTPYEISPGVNDIVLVEKEQASVAYVNATDSTIRWEFGKPLPFTLVLAYLNKFAAW